MSAQHYLVCKLLFTQLHFISCSEIAENEAQHLITSADDDNDGRLSVQEIIDSHEVFVGSEATHFGEQLRDEL